MTIRYVDSTGKPWAFELDCTPLQGRMFASLLRSVRNIGSREELCLTFYERYEENAAFRGGIEHAVLSALRDWAHSATTDGANVLGDVANVNASTANGMANVMDDDTDDRVHYYWENF